MISRIYWIQVKVCRIDSLEKVVSCFFETILLNPVILSDKVTVHRMHRICHSRLFWAGIHTFSDKWMPGNLLANGRA